MKLTIKELCNIAICTAVIAILAQITIPMPLGVPMTMQTFAVAFAGVVLGAKRGTISVVVYLALGAIGLPVFAGMNSGVSTILGSTGGFLLSFPIVAFLAGWGAGKNKIWLSIGLLLGMVINLFCGMVMFSAVTGSDLYKSFIACVAPFIVNGIVKAVLAGILGMQVKSALLKIVVIAE